MAKTAREVITEALRDLNYIDRTAQADGDIYEKAKGKYEVFHNWGRAMYPRKWSWSSDAVDERYWTQVVDLFAGRIALNIPVSESTRQRAIASAAEARTFLNQQFRHKKVLKQPRYP